MNHFVPRVSTDGDPAPTRDDGKPLQDLRGAVPHPGTVNSSDYASGDDGGERSGGSATCALRDRDEIEVNEGANSNSRSRKRLRGDVRPERSRQWQTRQCSGEPRRWAAQRNDARWHRARRHRQAAGIVAVVSMRRERRGTERDERAQRRESDTCGWARNQRSIDDPG